MNQKMNFEQIIAICKIRGLLDETNKNMIAKLEHYPDVHVFFSDFPHANCETILKALNCLDRKKLLNKAILNRCLEIAITPGKPARFGEDPSLFDAEIFLLLSHLEEYDISIDATQLGVILNLKKRNAQRLINLIDDFHKANLLNSNTFANALTRITERPPAVIESSFYKTQKNETQLQRSSIKLEDEITIYPDEKKEKLRGGQGAVKKAYTTSYDTTPTYMLKKIDTNHVQKDKKDAKREAKHNKFFGNAYFFYKNNKARVISEWRQGEALNKLKPQILIQTSYENRLRSLESGLFYLNELHRRYRVHGDISNANFIIDLGNNKMHLIDFGSAHKVGSPHHFPYNRDYHEPMERRQMPTCNTTHSLIFFADLYAMGIVVAEMFPELFSITWAKSGHATTVLFKTGTLPIEKAIIRLVNVLTNPDRTISCNSEDALNYCQKLIEGYSNLDDNKIEALANETIGRTATTFEDVFRGIIRSSAKG